MIHVHFYQYHPDRRMLYLSSVAGYRDDLGWHTVKIRDSTKDLKLLGSRISLYTLHTRYGCEQMLTFLEELQNSNASEKQQGAILIVRQMIKTLLRRHVIKETEDVMRDLDMDGATT